MINKVENIFRILATPRVAIVLVIAIIWSCNKSPSGNSQQIPKAYIEKLGLVVSDTLTIPIDSVTDFHTLNLQYYYNEQGKKEFIIYENRNRPSVQMYAIATRSLEKEGPDGVSVLRGFLMINEDSLIVYSRVKRMLFLIDRLGAVIKRFSLLKDVRSDFYSVPKCYTYQPMVYDNMTKNIFMVAAPSGDYNLPGYWSGPLGISLNIESEQISYNLFQVPEEYYNQVYGAFFSYFSVTKNDNGQFVYGFPFDSEIIVTDYDNPHTKHYAGSKFFDFIPEWENPISGKSEPFYVESNSYRELVYDKWRNVYYRFAYQGVNYISTSGEQRDWNDKKPSIVILDRQFENVGEPVLATGTYFTRNFFVGKEGLYISNNHRKNKNLSKDHLSFTLFKLQQLNQPG